MSAPLRFQVQVDDQPVKVGVQSTRTTVAAPGAPRIIFAATPGKKGDRGLPGEGVPRFGEYLIGIKNGSNVTFQTVDAFRAGTTALYINGLREDVLDSYSEVAPNTIVLSDPPSTTDKLTIDYIVQ